MNSITTKQFMEIILLVQTMVFLLLVMLGFVVIKAQDKIIREIERRAKRNTQLNSPPLKHTGEEGAPVWLWNNSSMSGQDLSSQHGDLNETRRFE